MDDLESCECAFAFKENYEFLANEIVWEVKLHFIIIAI